MKKVAYLCITLLLCAFVKSAHGSSNFWDYMDREVAEKINLLVVDKNEAMASSAISFSGKMAHARTSKLTPITMQIVANALLFNLTKIGSEKCIEMNDIIALVKKFTQNAGGPYIGPINNKTITCYLDILEQCEQIVHVRQMWQGKEKHKIVLPLNCALAKAYLNLRPRTSSVLKDLNVWDQLIPVETKIDNISRQIQYGVDVLKSQNLDPQGASELREELDILRRQKEEMITEQNKRALKSQHVPELIRSNAIIGFAPVLSQQVLRQDSPPAEEDTTVVEEPMDVSPDEFEVYEDSESY